MCDRQVVLAVILALGFGVSVPSTAAALDLAEVQRPISDLRTVAKLHLGKTADWVVMTSDAVWVGGTGPGAVYKIDPETNRQTAAVSLPGDPCAGLAAGFGALWVPLCGDHPALARVDLKTGAVILLPIAPAGAEGGIAVSGDSVWMPTDKLGGLARIDPATGAVRQRVMLPAGSYNPHASGDRLWVTSVEGGVVTALDAATGAVVVSVKTGPAPRFLTTGGGAVWTLNQGDGTLTRVDERRRKITATIALGTPGHGGDIAYGAGRVWTTMSKTPLTETDAKTGRVIRQWIGPGGDSLGIGFGSIWLTDYDRGDVVRIRLKDAMKR